MNQSSYIDQSAFSHYLGHSTIVHSSSSRKISQKDKMIEFYQEEKIRR
jgi:hypothetical protein